MTKEFFTRDAFEKLGDYKEIGIMEDYDISISAKRMYDLVQIDTRIVTSSRRFYAGKGRSNEPRLVVMRDIQVFQRDYREGIDSNSIAKIYYKH